MDEKIQLEYEFKLYKTVILFKIKLCSETISNFEECCETVIIPNQHHVLSLDIKDGIFVNNFFKYCIIDSSFHNLQSIILRDILIELVVVPLFHLRLLPNLLSLTLICHLLFPKDISDIYRLIFSLPTLKYNKISLEELNYEYDDINETNISLPAGILHQQFSTIECFVINHECTFDELIFILCHTPQLRHLICGNLLKTDQNVEDEQIPTLSYLKHIRIDCCYLDFNDFERFIKKVSPQLQRLRIKSNFKKAYLDADRWERLITNYIPHLDTLIYNCYQHSFMIYEDRSLHLIINQFSSPFWVNKGWIFEIFIDCRIIHFSIHSSKKTCFDFDEKKETIMTHPKSNNLAIQLMIHSFTSNPKRNQSLIDNYKFMFDSIKFIHLTINCATISSDMFIQIIEMLPHLVSLHTLSIPIIQNNADILHRVSLKNKITQVKLEKITEIEQVMFVLRLCRCMKHFQINENVPHLTCLCINISNNNEHILNELQNLIDTEYLLDNYTMKLVGHNIILQLY
ncbi:unnamed protein product [Adineta steineri]|uniref:F-box domain-containing protein n=1 Tax=Adineta steineri TaxID=433720 RepID=A0A819MPH9_9BILA|nr:unnamed protein product [Adineta steineri]CAF3983129.1 unnamed protein product [Adineta steineri]